ncbi:2'-5' RNA ligase family protein [Palleronia sediminis]|nr:2'-5' RNA ligase family protein [Palleronia sediminis]
MALILTLGFDAPSFARLEPLRQRHFPPARNFIPVHVTLFQQLPSDAIARVLADLAAAAARHAPLPFAATGIVDFGGGAAVALDCPPARALHCDLRDAWRDMLSTSDDRARKLHATVQNKVDRDTARATQAQLRAGFTPWSGVFDALRLWHYRGGPWEDAGTFPFRGDSE